MRKWMRERLQRRKKKAEEQASQPSPPPLQPAYFDGDEKPSEAPPHASEPEGPAEETPAETESSRKGSSSDQPVESDRKRPRRDRQEGRGRRRRGGRGRGGKGGREQAVAQAFAPGKASTTEAPVDEALADIPEESGEPGLTVEPEPEPTAEATPVPKAPAVPAAIPAAPARPPKGIVVLAIGLPGSGKSTWFKRHNLIPLSSDMVRTLLFDDVREQRFQDLVFSNLRSMLKARLIAKRPMNYVDATNLTPQERQHWVKLAKDYNYEVHAVFFDVPLDVCIERHQRRDRVVPEDVMRRMAAKLKPPSFDEGFAKITVVRVKKKAEG
jgi:predicted kinase